LSNTAGHIAVI